MFSDNLRRRRLELGLSQGELAEKVGYRSRSSITKLESGICDVTQKKLQAIADALNIAPEDLIGEKQPLIKASMPRSRAKFDGKGRAVALIQAGGRSTRNMLSIPSQFVCVDDKPIITYVMEAYERHPLIDEINVVCLYGWEKTLQSYAEKHNITKLKRIITGGYSIMDSVQIGFGAIRKELADDDVVILQEATRPMINIGLISKIISAYNEFGDSVFVKPMAEYVQIKMSKGVSELCNRNNFFSIESPEIYSAASLREGLTRLRKETRDDGSCCAVMMARLGRPLHYCETTANNMKIVKQEDIYIFKVLRQVIL